MAPIKHPEWPDVPATRDEFFQDVQNFHLERGTVMDPTPKVSTVPIDLYELFQIVQENGGYDSVSQQKLQWRRLAERHWGLGGNNNAAAYAFQLKSLFYRNLAAYAIARVYKQEPPPKEILELITAKGANLLNRTVESWRKDQTARGKPVERSDDDSSDHEATPRTDRVVVEDGSAARTRLRQAPPQRQFFQPDLSSTRQPRQVVQQFPPQQAMATPPQMYVPAPMPQANIHSSSFQIGSWEGRNPNLGLHVRPVPTPSNNLAAFRDKAKKLRDAKLLEYGKLPAASAPLPPGSGFSGPNILKRCIMSLRSGIPNEQAFALYHLVKISFERGESLILKQFPGLTDGLIDKGLEVASLFYDVKWNVYYDQFNPSADPSDLDGINGTGDLLERIAKLRPLTSESVAFATQQEALLGATETALILRNLSLLDANAAYLSRETHLGDLMTIWLTLPRNDSVIELQQYALEIMEELTCYWGRMDIPRPLYLTLAKRLEEALEIGDKGSSLSIIRSLTHIGSLRGEEALLSDISIPTIQRLLDWLLIDDDSLIGTCLDFFYRYFASPENTATFLKECAAGNINHDAYFHRLVRLMSLGARENHWIIRAKPAIHATTATEIAPMPEDLKEDLVGLPEPGRSSAWLRALFEENADSDIKQITLWQGYQGCFNNTAVPLLAAADFIKNVSTTFTSANAQVINGPTPKFIIKGIRYRHAPVPLEGPPYLRCKWNIPAKAPAEGVPANQPPNVPATSQMPNNQPQLQVSSRRPRTEQPCGTFHKDGARLWEHVLTQHLGLSRNDEGNWDIPALRLQIATSGQEFICKWSYCHRFAEEGGITDPFQIGMHMKRHMPDTTPLGEHRAQHTKRKRPEYDDEEELEQPAEFPAEAEHLKFVDTPGDGRGHLAHIPVNSTLVLRMLARTIPRAVQYMEEHPHAKTVPETHEWMQLLMGGIWDDLWEIAAYNRTLAGCIIDVAIMVERGMEEEEGMMKDTV